jgi:hypothetical protein
LLHCLRRLFVAALSQFRNETRMDSVVSGLVIRREQFQFVFREGYAEFFVRPFSQVDHFAALAAKRAERIIGIPG